MPVANIKAFTIVKLKAIRKKNIAIQLRSTFVQNINHIKIIGI